MSEEQQNTRALEDVVREIAERGIQTDPQQLKKDMCAQFSNPREWIREYATNASDAGARHFWVTAREDDATLTVCVEDDGRGMNRAGVLDFLKVFRSVKQGDLRRAVGRHGIGKLSVAAIEGQCGFLMRTSTGKETWQVQAGCLLDDTNIVATRLPAEGDHGTRFEITFQKKGVARREELLKLLEVLQRYVKYLAMRIVVLVPQSDEHDSPEHPQRVRGEWGPEAERCGRSYAFSLHGMSYEVVLGIGDDAAEEIYQNGVLISDSYDLLSCDTDRKLFIPHLRIRVESGDFELPFGRHRLVNEGVLRGLAYHLREHVVPGYVAELCRLYDAHLFADYQVTQIAVEEIACALMAYDPFNEHTWCHLPVFKLVNPGIAPRISLAQLRREVERAGILYLADAVDPGMDYTLFPAPVLAKQQPARALDVATTLFGKKMVNLSQKDVVLVAPAGSAPELGAREKKLEQCLHFHPAALRQARRGTVGAASRSSSKPMSSLTTEEIRRAFGVCEEAMQAEEDLACVRWRVHYLVCRDGKTPCATQRFLFRDETVMLNLHHAEVKQLLALADKAPQLAGHWGLAMCLADGQTILPHLSAEARADLILSDAIAKAHQPAPAADEDEEVEGSADPNFQEFLRNLDDPTFGVE
jgi:hypothetical protein